jgi:hypothetical protein
MLLERGRLREELSPELFEALELEPPDGKRGGQALEEIGLPEEQLLCI